LFLWSIIGQRDDAHAVIDAWGFTRKDEIVWHKLATPGRGAYTRHVHETLLIAIRGSWPPPSAKRRHPSVITVERGRHSEKPDVFYEVIEHMYPGAHRRLELFARSRREGWTSWGNQLGDAPGGDKRARRAA
jgi:N6-adenosine-specific RNA methylase IME4